ncbi:hypothetical protein [Jiangella anatolica]|uniref:DUF4232 domain-containing protein n=1 Tax=Jiangella anatolica TaxID=2670374 RepID=A0A2W2CA26_9ACTN|nr:hypothetical protein [Jiangella anatolica]PZF82636.1 hypothetical protein C1I92_16005 [Jiangella anatolica]
MDTPLDLGVVGAPPDEPDEEPPRGRGGWRVWTAIAAAFVLGGGLGLFVADAREDAASYSDVRLVSGALQAIPDRADEESPGRIQLSLLNLGEHEVEILGLELPGMTVRPDDEPSAPVAAPPGEWVSAGQDGLIADCAGTDPGDDAPVRVRVRDAGGTERLVEVGALPDFGGALEVWGYVCRGPELVFPGGATVRVNDDGSVTTTLQVANSGSEPMEISRFQTLAPGLSTTGPEVPFELPPNEALDVPVTWTVTDCRLALQWVAPEIEYSIGSGTTSMPGWHPLTGAAQAELILMVDRVCGDGP